MARNDIIKLYVGVAWAMFTSGAIACVFTKSAWPVAVVAVAWLLSFGTSSIQPTVPDTYKQERNDVDTQGILDKFAAEQGWDEASQIDVLLRYIENQGSDDAFHDFLAEAAAQENEGA